MKQLQGNEKTDLAFGPGLVLRFYGDSRPHVFQTAELQKGAIVVSRGKELVEEGLGLGVPVCRYQDGTRFSINATTFVDDSNENKVVKIYDMNGIASKRFRRFPIQRASPLARLLAVLEKGYRGLRRFNTVATAMLTTLSLLGMRNEYLESQSKGRIAVIYSRTITGLEIEANFEELSLCGLTGIVFANEQSGRLFDEYGDSTGAQLRDRQIEPWRATQAKWANLYCQTFRVGFRIHRPNGWLVVRGREVVRDRVSWSGLDLSSTQTPHALKYLIEIVEDGF